MLTTAATQSANAIALDTGEGAALNRFASELAHAIAGCARHQIRAGATRSEFMLWTNLSEIARE
ncbi:hypothetical protein APY03_4957 [Variovorax sp. WDL1]|nr:hypothetical protein APY03_4957 [Variovorax sp. WDL1]